MELKNCTRCGDLFLAEGDMKICSNCIKKDEEDFETVKSFLWNNPKATLPMIAKETGVSEKKISTYVKEGRIKIADMDVPGCTCEICGKAISFGKVCSDCLGELNGAIESLKPKKHDQLFTKR